MQKQEIVQYALRYALWIVLAHILVGGILVAMFEPSYLVKSAGAVAAVASLLLGRALWAKQRAN